MSSSGLEYNVFFMLGSPLPLLCSMGSLHLVGDDLLLSFQYVFRLYHGSLAQEI